MTLPLYSITDDPGKSIEKLLSELSFSNAMVLIDENTEEYCLPKLPQISQFETIRINSGEQHKNLETCGLIWEKMTEAGLDRKAILINLGGGVIGDMGGFCAATYKRGIRFINIPTTLLSQVDASVGGKLGIDFHGFKNHIGVFENPLTVIISPYFLSTLNQRELRSGFAEVLKHGMIADKDHFMKAASADFDNIDWIPLIRDSVSIKERVVLDDPTEKGLRKVLNFGHTTGHAIETFYLNTPDRLLHGEAIAIGMICESWLSKEKIGLSDQEFETIVDVISRVFPKREQLSQIDPDALTLMFQDKKNVNNRILSTLIPNIGKATWDVEITLLEAKKALDFYNKLPAQA